MRCADRPSVCGYPDRTNTGLLPGTKLIDVPSQAKSGPGWTWHDGSVDITGNNVVFSGFSVAGTVNVFGDRVTVQNCRVRFAGGGGDSFGIAVRHASNTTVQFCDISGVKPTGGTDPERLTVGVKNIYGDEHETHVVANDISDAACGVQLDSGVVLDNYIHNTATNGDDHVNGVMSNAGGALRIERNTIFNQLSQTSAIALYENFGVQRDKTITNNLLAGGGYTIYGGGPDHGRGQPSRIVIADNRFSPRFAPRSGTYGPIAYYDAKAAGSSFIQNVWDDNDTLLRLS